MKIKGKKNMKVPSLFYTSKCRLKLPQEIMYIQQRNTIYEIRINLLNLLPYK